MSETNGTPVTVAMLNDKLEIIRSEQRLEHLKTRAVVLGVGLLSGGAKALSLLGYIRIPHF